jgi:Cell division protein CrgA
VPESRRRKPKKKQTYRGPAAQPVKLSRSTTNPVWLVPTMLVLFGLAAVWLLTYYFSNCGVLGMQHLGGWNILIGFGLAVIGLGLATRWK